MTFFLRYHYLNNVFFLFLLFFFKLLKPKLFYQYLFKSLQKQQLTGILLNMYVFNLVNFTNLCRLLATFFNTQKTFQRCPNLVVRVIWLHNVGQYQINVETMLCVYTLKFTTLNNVTLTSSISTLILTTLDNAETMLFFVNVETTFCICIWPFSKS